MTFEEMIEGLQILAKYLKGLESDLNANHDVVLACTAEIDWDAEEKFDEYGDLILTDTRVSIEDAARLGELGWFIAAEYGDSWTHFC